jgi:hypothetical protein
VEPGPETKLREGRYVIVRKLGEGAQGTTYDAVDQLRGQPVAIKRFSVRGAASWKDVELAEREAKVLEALSHPALPAFVEHFEEDGALYLVMEKIEGETLHQRAKRPGTLSRDDVVRFLRDASDALDYLHGRSPPVIHRDINPKNVVRRPDGSHAIVDFGAVRDSLKPEGGSTVVGTFGYMAPEQFQGRALPTSDVYAVGATALRLLTGTDPEDLPHTGLAIDVAAALGPGFDPGLRRALTHMLVIDPDRRAGSVREALRALEPPGTERRKFRGKARWDLPASRREGDLEDWLEHTLEATLEGRLGHLGESRKARRRMRRVQKRLHRAHRRRRGPPVPFLLLGLQVAILVVGVVLCFAVPTLLALLSLVFGRGLREAAHNVRRAGLRAQESMREAQARLLGRGDAAASGEREDDQAEEQPGVAQPGPERTRIEDDRPSRRERVRFDEGDVVDVEGTEVDDLEPRKQRARRL